MPYETIEDLPADLKDSMPEGARRIFVAAYRSAMSDGLNEEDARQVGFNSLRNMYVRNANGQWEPKPEEITGNPTGAMSGS
ncbi:ChaB family protein [Pannus brasiliensis CCIBt3594]|uniref:ChaB family protein n=1 Tax=Pannus brasiliensis CCIBt3594 TaxID=1427578 RepID=A0AAW9QXK5_9CHRO